MGGGFFFIELSAKPGFLSPFLIACGTRNAKFSTIGVVCLQRLIVSRALAKVHTLFDNCHFSFLDEGNYEGSHIHSRG